MNFLSKIVISGLLGIASLLGYHTPVVEAPVAFGSFTPVGTTQFTLAGAGITSSETTIQLTSFLLPDRVTPITMSMIGSIGYGVLEPSSPSKIENITFTGITQNANGTAILTGVSRGISFYSPYAASTTLAKSHGGGQPFIISNSASFYGQQFAMLNNNQTLTGLNTFTDPPIFTNAATSTLQGASIAYVNGIAFGSSIIPASLGGTGNSTNPLNMLLVGNGGSAITATSSPTVAYVTATSTTATSTFAGNVNIGKTLNASSFTNIIASSTQYIVNAGTINATSSIKINGASVLTSTVVPRYTYFGSGGSTGTNGYATTTTITIPAGVLTASSTISFDMSTSCNNGNGSNQDCTFYLKDGTGATIMSTGGCTTVTTATSVGNIRGLITFGGGLSAATYAVRGFMYVNGANIANAAGTINIGTNGTITPNFANAVTLNVVVFGGASSVGATASNISIIVNP